LYNGFTNPKIFTITEIVAFVPYVKFEGIINLSDVLTQYEVLGLYGLVSDGKGLYLTGLKSWLRFP
jgi:hypothetical protein